MLQFAQLTALATFILLIAGGLVTSTDSGLAVPDWPLSYGTLFPPMVGGIRFEHTHRLIAGLVAVMIGILAMWLRLREPRRWVRRLGYLAFAIVLAQAILGGLTVLFLLPPSISVAHACLGQVLFCLVVCVATVLSPNWKPLSSITTEATPSSIQFASFCLLAALVYQLIVGAILRHAGYALFLHLAGAGLIAVLIVWLWWNMPRASEAHLLIRTMGLGVGGQVALGLVGWAHRDHALVTTAHQGLGALLLAGVTVLVMRYTKYEIRKTISDRLHAYWELTKPRVTMMALLTTAVGFLMGSTVFTDTWRLLPTLLGAWLVGAGANALNQWYEREADALMERTKDRPLPSGRLQAHDALIFGTAGVIVGLMGLWYFVNEMATWCALMTAVIYVGIYTPMKRRSSFCTLVGAIPGALPPLIGWTASAGTFGLEAWVLFAILFLWQLPHFLAIAWWYQDDYRHAGFRMLPVTDPSGESTARQMVVYGLALLLTSLFPTLLGMTGPLYFVAAFIMGSWLLWATVRAAHRHSPAIAHRVFFASIGYLPSVLFIMVVDKTFL